MGTIQDQVEGTHNGADERCPICARGNSLGDQCGHVRWTFEQGGPLDFAKYAMQASPYVRGRGHRWTDIPQTWWLERGDWIIEQIDFRLHIGDGFVFGELVDLDLLARDVWKAFRPDHERASLQRVDA